MNQEILAYLSNLLGIDGYVIRKPENTPYPAFVVSSSTSRDIPVFNNNGKPLGYTYGIQINLIGTRYSDVSSRAKDVISALDGFSGDIGGVNVMDAQLDSESEFQNSNKNFEKVIDMTFRTLI